MLVSGLRSSGAIGEDLHLAFDSTADLSHWRGGGGTVSVTAHGVGPDEGVIGGGVRFDGSASIDVSEGFSEGGTFTLECWLKPDELSHDDGPINIMTRDEQFLLRLNPLKGGRLLSFFVYVDGRWEPRVYGDALEGGRWHHVIVMWWGKGLAMWVNGMPFHTPREGVLPTGKGPIRIGGGNSYGAGFSGAMDTISLYPTAHSQAWAMRRIWLHGESVSAPAFTRREFVLPRDASVFTALGEASVKAEGSALSVHLPRPTSALVVRNGLCIPVETGEGWLLSMSAVGARRLELIAFTSQHYASSQTIVIPDGKERAVFVPLDSHSLNGPLEAIVIRFRDAAENARIFLSSMRLILPPPLSPQLDVRTFAPERRYCAPGASVSLHAEITNRGAGDGQIALSLCLPEGVRLLDGELTQRVDVAARGFASLLWAVAADVVGSYELVLMSQREDNSSQSAVTRLVVSVDPTTIAEDAGENAPMTTVPYPRAMDFRHLGSQRLETYAEQSMLLVDLIGEKIESARAFKKRYPDVVVLMQVNDEPNGLWGSWFTVPKEFALKAGLRCRPDVFPMPDFKGFWMLRPGADVRLPIRCADEEFDIEAPEPCRFVQRTFGGRGEAFQDCLLYRRSADGPEFQHAEYVSVVSVDRVTRRVRFRRWPRKIVGEWHEFSAGEAYVAPSAGDVYSQKGKRICTWVPNLTKFCPRDPATGMDAAEWWAAHFATLWHRTIARDKPHPDGYQFDWAPFRAHKKDADADNDGVADGAEFAGISYWGLGMHRFFHLLRTGGDSWRGIGWDALLLADSSSPASQRSFSVLNGSENEEFCGFDRRRNFSAQFDLYRTWARYSLSPHLAYLQSRFPCEIWYEGDLSQEMQKTKFRMSNHIRLAAAAACMELGIHTYRPGGRADVDDINRAQGGVRFDIDAHHAGSEHRFGWLGFPLEEARYIGAGEVAPTDVPCDGWKTTGRTEHVFWSDLAVDPHEKKIHLQVEAIHVVRPSAEDAACWSPVLPADLVGQGAMTLLFDVRADPVYDDVEGDLYKGIMRSVSFVAEAGGIRGDGQTILAGEQWRSVRLVLPVRGKGQVRIGILYGEELGSVWVRGLRLLPGQRVAMSRRFSNGLVVMNPSAQEALMVNLRGEAGENRGLRRLQGLHEPWPNTGDGVANEVCVPVEDALFLRVF